MPRYGIKNKKKSILLQKCASNEHPEVCNSICSSEFYQLTLVGVHL